MRSLVGLDRSAVVEAFEDYLDETRYTVDQVRFVRMVVDELTTNGLMAPARLFESPYVDQAATRLDLIFTKQSEADGIVKVLNDVRSHALPSGAA